MHHCNREPDFEKTKQNKKQNKNKNKKQSCLWNTLNEQDNDNHYVTLTNDFWTSAFEKHW